MKLDVSIDVDLCIEGKNVVLYVSDGDDVVNECEFSIYELVKGYLEGYAIPSGGYHLDAEDIAEIEALVSELDDALLLANKVIEPEDD
jgi:hypothetical protein